MVSSVTYRPRWTAHSSFCSRRIAPTRRVIASDTDDFGSALDLAVDAFERIGGMQLDPMLGGKAQIREDVGLCFVKECGEFG
jgi:hypothetical protein